VNRLVRAELLKLRTTRTAWGLLIGLVPYVALNAFGQFAQSAFAGTQTSGGARPPALSDPQAIRGVLSGALSARTLLLVLGILMITTEYRHQTATPTFLAAPRRSLVVGAKLIAASAVGVVYGIVAVVVAAVTGFICYAAKGETFTLNVAKAPQAIIGIVGVVAIYTVIGIGLGTLVRNQVAAILIAVGWTLAAEAIVTLLLTLWHHQGDKIYRWFPGNAASAITEQFLGGGLRLLAPWAGALVLVGYGLVFAALGSV
jgi:ABC-type transport system involved in multi-copper enzyme maturation permease subunit